MSIVRGCEINQNYSLLLLEVFEHTIQIELCCIFNVFYIWSWSLGLVENSRKNHEQKGKNRSERDLRSCEVT